ncbi:MAG: hypothetical protein AVDCRST_MAG19-1231 [uncultured Thermomicrobiales bacterium]|uniref:Uncharacterized protein n=1 Tax=uncultured Thermomicrobiales bacterium TaxID=1645740 RepID=A0A6J4UTV5_9BACT|nr:MAG: hypothetical protein AVDCRST_MAG19-1231 [uncultured Thermomicrobiales bacterium]
MTSTPRRSLGVGTIGTPAGDRTTQEVPTAAPGDVRDRTSARG